MKDLKEFILEKRIRELKVDGKKVPDKYIVVFNDYLVEIAEKLKTHDRELVKKVCEKIKAELLPYFSGSNDYEEKYHYIVIEILQNLQKEYEK